jgi:Predicted membrane protein (DUF2207)/LemA family
MRRYFGWLILFLLTAVGLLWPLVLGSGSSAGTTTDPVVLTDYHVDYVVNAEGRLDAVETITGDFPSGRHGIFRYWDVANSNSSRIRQVPDITSILMDGEPAPYQMLWESDDRFRVAKIGDPDNTVSAGLHTYELRYSIPGVLDPGSTGENRRFAYVVGRPNSTSAFFWNVIAPSWNNYIKRIDVHVTLPADVTGAQCSVGSGVGRACTGLTVQGHTVEFTATQLEPRTPVTLRGAAEKELDTALQQTLALGASYPELKSSTNFLNLQENLADTEDKLAFARQYYNDAVATLNRVIGNIPWNLVVPLTGVSPREYYEIAR